MDSPALLSNPGFADLLLGLTEWLIIGLLDRSVFEMILQKRLLPQCWSFTCYSRSSISLEYHGRYDPCYEPMILLLFARLHFQHKVWRLSSTVRPPLDTGIIWSISSKRFGSILVELPQLQQVKWSRALMNSRSFFVISVRYSLAKAVAVSLLSSTLISSAMVSSVMGTVNDLCAIPPPEVYENLYSTVSTLSLIVANPSRE